MSETGSAITRRKLNVQPTIKVPAGYRFTVRVDRDILFDGRYEPIQADPQPFPKECSCSSCCACFLSSAGKEGIVTSSELAKEVCSIVEAKILGRPSAAEFEMTYQARIAMDQIRFPITQVEKHMPGKEFASETSLQVVDALDRLESADRHFRERFHLRLRLSTWPKSEWQIFSRWPSPAIVRRVEGIRRELGTLFVREVDGMAVTRHSPEAERLLAKGRGP
jgi:hypothetical protein